PDSLLLAAADRQKLLFQSPAVNYSREDVCKRLEEVNVIVNEFSAFDRVCPQYTIRFTAAVDNHRDTTDHPVVQKERRLSESRFGGEILNNHRRVRGERKTCGRFSSRNEFSVPHVALFPTCACA